VWSFAAPNRNSRARSGTRRLWSRRRKPPTQGQVGEADLYLTVRPLLAQHHRAAIIKSNNVKRVLADIDADYGSRRLCCCGHGVLLGWASLTSLSLAEQEHGPEALAQAWERRRKHWARAWDFDHDPSCRRVDVDGGSWSPARGLVRSSRGVCNGHWPRR
jgi:hypothetical protein